MFISEEMKAYPCSFMVEPTDGVQLIDKNLLDVWKNSELFERFRDNLRTFSCFEHTTTIICEGGCQLYPEINLSD